MDIAAFLQEHGITYEWFDHPAVFTCEESVSLPAMPGADTKNLFLRDKKRTQYFLVTVGHDKKVDLKELGKDLYVKGLTFASPDELKRHLGVLPGSVTLMGLVYDADHAVHVVIDEALWLADAVRCHPLKNTASIVISHEGLETFLEKTGHTAKVINVPAVL